MLVLYRLVIYKRSANKGTFIMKGKLTFSCAFFLTTLVYAGDVELNTINNKTSKIDFANIQVGQSVQYVVSITYPKPISTLPTKDLPLILVSPFSITDTNSNGAYFSVNTNFPITGGKNAGCTDVLASGETCKIAITFTPKSTGMVTGKLIISETEDNSGNLQPDLFIDLVGTGILPLTSTCTTGQELIGGKCITTNSLPKLGLPLIISGDPKINPQTTITTLFGGVSVDGGVPSKENLEVKTNQTISVNGLIVPEHQGTAEIIAVGLYVPTDKLTGRATAKEYCDPVLGDFYMNTAGDSSNNTDNYCNWIVDRNGVDTSGWCNTPNDNRRAALSYDVMDFWNVWSGHLNTLKPMYSNVSLDSNGVSKLLYKDTVNYTGQVCIYFGYRLVDQSLVFNGEPIIFRVTP